jgi:PAS domain S-box-containing protein
MGDPLNYILAAMTGAFLYAGCLHFLSERELANRLFGVLCWLAAGYCIANLVALEASTSAEVIAAVRWRSASLVLLYVSLLWFMKALTKAVPAPLAVAATLAYGVLLAANALLPAGIGFAGSAFPAGEVNANAAAVRGTAAPWIPLLWIVHMTVLGTCLNACRKGFRSDQRREALLIAIMLAAVMLSLATSLFDTRLFDPDSVVSTRRLNEAARLGLVVAISFVLRRRITTYNSQLSALIDHVPAFVFMKDRAGRYVFVNRYWLDQFQRSAATSLGKTDLDIFPTEVADTYRSNDQRVFAEGKLLEFEEASSPLGDTARIYSSLKFPIQDAGGSPRLLGGISTDVTDIVRLQRALSASESRLHSAMEAAHIASWELDYVTHAMLWSDNAHLIYGQPAGDFLPTMEAALSAIIPEDRAQVMQLVEQALADAGSGYLAEYRIVRQDGEIRWIEARGRFTRNSDGSFHRMLGTVIDISDRKRAELAEHESQQRFRNLAAATFEGIAITENAVIIDVNDQLLDMFGYTRDEALGKPLTVAVAPESLDNVTYMIRSGANEPYEATVLRSDGSRFQIEVRARSFTLGNRSVRISAFRDITLRKQAEESLRIAQETELRIREEFARHLLTAQEQERKRLANDLHDGLGQSLALIRNRASMALSIEESRAAASHLTSIMDLAGTSIAELRNLLQLLRPLHIEQLGLTQSLQGLLEQTAASTTIRLGFTLDDVDDLFPAEGATHVYRIAQEALSNMLKHSRATAGQVSLERDIHCVRLVITDDGAGFDARQAAFKGLGLTSILERTHMLGGELDLQSEPGTGTRIRIEFPLGSAAMAASVTES